MKKELSRSYYGQKIKQSNMVFEYRYYQLDEEGELINDNVEYSEKVFTIEKFVSIEEALKECKFFDCNNIELYCWINDDNENEILQAICDVCNLDEDGIQWIYDLHTSHVVLSSSINVAMPSKILKDWNQAKNK
jgi:hypothetical protein